MTETFFKYLQFEKRLSRNTVSAYQIDINQFSTFLKDTFDVDDLALANHGMIRSWIVGLTDDGLLPLSVNRKVAALRALYKFMQAQGVVATNPTNKITALKAARRLPSFVREQEMDLMLGDATIADDFEGVRDRLILELFYGTGMRLSELLGLKDQSFNMPEQTVKVLGKRNKERVIPFSKVLIPLIDIYLSKRAQLDSPLPGERFFVSSSGQPCYPMLIYRMVKRQMSATSAERKSPHILRHTYATHLLDRGAEINAVKDLLGHSSLSATQVYTHNSMEKIKKVFNQAHPKA